MEGSLFKSTNILLTSFRLVTNAGDHLRTGATALRMRRNAKFPLDQQFQQPPP